MNSLITEFKKQSKLFQETVASFPTSQREEKLFDQWSLKDIIAHLIGWDEHFLEELENLKNNQVEKSVWVKISDQNNASIKKYQNFEWLELINTYQTTSQQLVANLESLPEKLWKIPLFPNKKNRTPEKYLKIWVQHTSDHIKQIKSLRII